MNDANKLTHQVVAVAQGDSDSDYARIICICGYSCSVSESKYMEYHISKENKLNKGEQ